MKIKIISAKTEGLWYSKKIGEELEAVLADGLYVLKHDSFYKLYECDCEVVTKNKADYKRITRRN